MDDEEFEKLIALAHSNNDQFMAMMVEDYAPDDLILLFKKVSLGLVVMGFSKPEQRAVNGLLLKGMLDVYESKKKRLDDLLGDRGMS